MTHQTSSQPLAVLFGGSGFLGRHTARMLVKCGWNVRIVSRNPDRAMFPDSTEHIEYMRADLKDSQSVRTALNNASAIVNLTGILSPTKQQSFDDVHRQGTQRIAAAANEMGITKFVQISAIGANSTSPSVYARSKAAGEHAVLSLIPQAIILRPSIIFGAEDSFFNRFSAIARFSPVLPLIGGGGTLFQPVFVDDVAEVVVRALSGHAQSGCIYELGGPEKRSFKELLRFICQTTRKWRILLPLPFSLAKSVAFAIETTNALLFGHLPPILLITRDQVELLRTDNIVSEKAHTNKCTFEGLGIIPKTIESVVPGYLSR